jgi:hypothetical protein
VIDTDAQVRAKQALAERLFTITRSGNGKVGDLVEAERAYAATQEELDSARMPGGQSPIRASLATAGDTLATSLAMLVTAAVAALPWLVAGAIALALLRWVRRKRDWRWPRRAQISSPPT